MKRISQLIQIFLDKREFYFRKKFFKLAEKKVRAMMQDIEKKNQRLREEEKRARGTARHGIYKEKNHTGRGVGREGKTNEKNERKRSCDE